MSAPIEYGWREASFAMARGGFYVRVEKFWCDENDGDAGGWRWSGADIRDLFTAYTLISEPMSRTQALDAAEKWIAGQIAALAAPAEARP